MTKAAIVLGASGSVGNALIDELLRDGGFSIVTLVRRARAEPDERIREVVVGDMTPAALEAATARAASGDVALSAVGFSVLGIGAGTGKITIAEHRAVDVELNAAFARGLRLLWERKRFQTARWSDLEAAFSDAAGRPLADFFRQWVDRPGAPEIRLKAATQTGDVLTLHFARPVGYQLGVSLRLTMGDGTEVRAIQLREGDATATLKVQGEVRSIELDPDYRLWRRVDAALLPPILRETFVAPKATLIVTDAAAELHSAALALSAKLLDAEPTVADALPDTGAALIVGSTASVDSWLTRHGLPARPDAVATRGSAQVWAGRDSQNSRPYAVVSARDVASLKALERGLPHYGKQSWLVFEGGRASDKAVWPPYAAPVTVKQVGVR